MTPSGLRYIVFMYSPVYCSFIDLHRNWGNQVGRRVDTGR